MVQCLIPPGACSVILHSTRMMLLVERPCVRTAGSGVADELHTVHGVHNAGVRTTKFTQSTDGWRVQMYLDKTLPYN